MTGRVVSVVAYSADWKKEFDIERQRLLQALGSNARCIDHIGSTAVAGLCAKPIIDMLIEVNSLAMLDQSSERMVALGYTVKGEYGIAGRRYFQKGGTERTHHVHAYEAGDDNLLRHLAFRDYLIANPEIRAEYAALKRGAAARYRGDPKSYQAAKAHFIQTHERSALELLKS